MPPSLTPDRAPSFARSIVLAVLVSVLVPGAARAAVIEFATYHGGCRGHQGIQDLAVDAGGDVVVAGFYPWDCDGGLPDAYVTRFTAGGERVFRAEFGGHVADEAKGVAIDAEGNLWVTGATRSSRCCRPFPTVDPYQADNAGGADAFLTKLDPSGATVLYSTFLGGSGDDRGTDVAIDGAGRIIVAGVTASTDFPTAAPTQPQPGGGEDAFVAVFEPAGAHLLFSTYLGGGGDDQAARLALAGDAVLVAGTTSSTNLPVTAPGPEGPFQPEYGGGASDAFVARFAIGGGGGGGGGALELLGYLGGSGRDEGHGIASAVGQGGAAVLAGSTDSTDFPTVAPLQPEPSLPPEPDAFLARVEPSGAALAYSTYLATGRPIACDRPPGATPIPCVGIAVDAAGDVFVSAPGAFLIKVAADGARRLDSHAGFGGTLGLVGDGGVLYAAGRTGSGLFPTFAAHDPNHRWFETEEGWLARLRDRPSPGAEFEEDDPRIAYAGTWTPEKWEGHSGGRALRTDQPGARAVITFEGTGIRLLGRRDPAGGIVRVTLDHDPDRQNLPLDLHAPEPEGRSVLLSFTGLNPGTHTLTLELTGDTNPRSQGTRFWLDGFDVFGAPSAANP